MVRASTLAALSFAAFLHAPSFEAWSGQDLNVPTLDDLNVSKALVDALGNRRCDEALGLIEYGETRNFLRPRIRFFQGVMYQSGNCAPRDWILAAKAYRSAATLGEKTSRLRLGRLHLEGLGVDSDRREAREWFQRLMYEMLNDPDDGRLAWLQKWWGEGELPGMLIEELAWLQRVEGDPQARMRVAVRILTGDGLPRDRKAAEKWLRSAADAQNSEAMLKLAQWQLDGKIDQHHDHEGVLLLYKMASAGYLPAMVDMALRLIKGIGVRKSDVDAYPWLLRAKWQGARVGEQLTAVGARLSRSYRYLGERLAKGGGRLPIPID